MVHVLGVDGNAVVHRAYHAGRHDPDRDATADPYWVTGIVVRLLAQAWRHGPFDGVVVGFDHDVNVRKQRFAEYKAHRPDKDDELAAVLEQVPGHLDGCGFTVVQPEGLEADDVMAALAGAACRRGWSASILSPDRDLLPLACTHVTVLQPGGVELRSCTPDRVRRDHGVAPDRYRLYAALRGDPSDGLPGVAGIGPKTAARLLRDHHDLAALYRNLPYLTTRVERALRAGRERLERNLEIMRPLPLPEPLDLERVVAEGVDLDLVDLELGSLGLSAVAGRLRGAVERPSQPAVPLAPPPEEEPVDLRDDRPVLVALAASDQAALF